VHHARRVGHAQSTTHGDQAADEGGRGLAAAGLEAAAGQQLHDQVGPGAAGAEGEDLDQAGVRQACEHFTLTQEPADQVLVAVDLGTQQLHRAGRGRAEPVLAPEDQGHAAFTQGLQEAHAANLRRGPQAAHGAGYARSRPPALAP